MSLAEYKKLNSRSTSQFFCKVLIKGVEISSQNIKSLVVRENVSELLPKLDLIFLDNGLFTEQFPLEDNDTINVQFGKNDELTPPISDLSFTLQDWEWENTDSEKATVKMVRLTGLFKVDSIFYPIRNKSFGEITSKECITTILTDLGITKTNMVGLLGLRL